MLNKYKTFKFLKVHSFNQHFVNLPLHYCFASTGYINCKTAGSMFRLLQKEGCSFAVGKWKILLPQGQFPMAARSCCCSSFSCCCYCCRFGLPLQLYLMLQSVPCLILGLTVRGRLSKYFISFHFVLVSIPSSFVCPGAVTYDDEC